MQDCNPTRIHTDPNTQLQKDMSTERVDPGTYRSLVGSLLFLTYTRPDICFAVSSVSKFMQEPQMAHYQAACKILRYLSGIVDHRIIMTTSNSGDYHAFADADWGRDINTRRSTSGILHRLGDSTIHWSSKCNQRYRCQALKQSIAY